MTLFPTPSPKDLALATWQHHQRPYFMAKIAHAQRKESGHKDPKISNPRK